MIFILLPPGKNCWLASYLDAAMLQAPPSGILYLLVVAWHDLKAKSSAAFWDGAFSFTPQMKYSTARAIGVAAKAE
jgi:hypothetical protein